MSVLRVDLNLVGSSYARRLRQEALHLILGERGSACNQACRPPSGGREGGQAIRPSPDSSDGSVENSPLTIYSACWAGRFVWRPGSSGNVEPLLRVRYVEQSESCREGFHVFVVGRHYVPRQR